VYWANMGLAQARRAHLSEIMWCSHYCMLAQASWASSSEFDGLAWAKTFGLTKIDAFTMFV